MGISFCSWLVLTCVCIFNHHQHKTVNLRATAAWQLVTIDCLGQVHLGWAWAPQISTLHQVHNMHSVEDWIEAQGRGRVNWLTDWLNWDIGLVLTLMVLYCRPVYLSYTLCYWLARLSGSLKVIACLPFVSVWAKTFCVFVCVLTGGSMTLIHNPATFGIFSRLKSLDTPFSTCFNS